jgi:hypothetical protein
MNAEAEHVFFSPVRGSHKIRSATTCHFLLTAPSGIVELIFFRVESLDLLASEDIEILATHHESQRGRVPVFGQYLIQQRPVSSKPEDLRLLVVLLSVNSFFWLVVIAVDGNDIRRVDEA